MNSKVKMLDKVLDWPNLNYVAVLENAQSRFKFSILTMIFFQEPIHFLQVSATS